MNLFFIVVLLFAAVGAQARIEGVAKSPDNVSISPSAMECDGTGTLEFDTDTMVVDCTNNRVGIGDTSPDTNLDVQGTSGMTLDYDAAGTLLKLIPAAANGDPVIQVSAVGGAAPDLVFKNDAGSELVRFANSGNVGIGTTAPGLFWMWLIQHSQFRILEQ